MLDADHEPILAELAATVRERITATQRAEAGQAMRCELTLTSVAALRGTVWVGRCECSDWEHIDSSASCVADAWIGHKRGDAVFS